MGPAIRRQAFIRLPRGYVARYTAKPLRFQRRYIRYERWEARSGTPGDERYPLRRSFDILPLPFSLS